MYKAKEDFLNYKKGQEVPDNIHMKIWIVKGHVEEIGKSKPVEKKDIFDINGDGKVDKDDRSLAAKILGSRKGRKKGKR